MPITAPSYWPPGDPIHSDDEDMFANARQADLEDPMFYAVELEKALSNCSYGVRTYENPVPDSRKPEATALVWLLEDDYKVYQVVLDIEGFSVREKHRRLSSFFKRITHRRGSEEDEHHAKPQQFSTKYNSLEQLLADLSPIFKRRRSSSENHHARVVEHYRPKI